MTAGDHTKALSAALDAVEELHTFIELAHAGLDYSKDAMEIDSLMRELGYRKEDPAPGAKDLRAKALQRLQQFATSQASRGFPYLYSLGLIRLTSILEIAVSDFVRDVLISEEALRRTSTILKLKGPIIQFAAATPGEQSDYLFEALSDQLGASLRRGVGRFEALLDAVGLGGAVEQSVRATLLELIETRNLYVHRGGTVDRKFLEVCPWVPSEIGTDFNVNRKLHQRCYAAVLWYLFEILRRETLRYPPSPDSNAAKIEAITRHQETLSVRAARQLENLTGEELRGRDG